MSDKQKQLNNRIAIELDKHCIQNEYGYLLLDQDKNIRDKYKWCANLSWAVWVDLGLSVLSGIIGLISNLYWSLYIGSLLFIVFAVYFFVRYFHRKDIAKMLDEKRRTELTDILKKHSEYVDNLRQWFMELGADKQTDSKTIKEFAIYYKISYPKGNQAYNTLSTLFGSMQEDLHNKARKKAIDKLSQLLQFHIK